MSTLIRNDHGRNETTRPMAAALALSLLLVGCNGKGSLKAGSTNPADPKASAGSIHTSPPRGSPATPSPTAAPTKNSLGALEPNPGPKLPPPFTAKLDKKCVHRGSADDMQGLRVRTQPGDLVGYSTIYSDESNELSNPTYKTGYGYGKANEDGDYHTAWIVPATAPIGVATVEVIASAGVEQRYVARLRFSLVDKNGRCP